MSHGISKLGILKDYCDMFVPFSFIFSKANKSFHVNFLRVSHKASEFGTRAIRQKILIFLKIIATFVNFSNLS